MTMVPGGQQKVSTRRDTDFGFIYLVTEANTLLESSAETISI